jgi:hypothetical protein
LVDLAVTRVLSCQSAVDGRPARHVLEPLNRQYVARQAGRHLLKRSEAEQDHGARVQG